MWFDPEKITRGSLNTHVGPGILLPLSKYDNTILLPGVEDAFGIILDGPHAGMALRAADGSNWSGVFVGDVRIEVDPDTRFSPTGMQRPPLSAVCSRDGVAVAATLSDGLPGRTQLLPWAGIPPRDSSEAIGYSAWRIVIDYNDEVLELYEHRGDPVTND